VTQRLSRDLNTEVKIDRISIEFFDKLNLEGALIRDQKKDTLLFAGKLKTQVTDWFFLKDEIELKYFGLEDAIVGLLRRMGQGLTALEIANHLASHPALANAFRNGGSQDVAAGPVMDALLSSQQVVRERRGSELRWRLRPSEERPHTPSPETLATVARNLRRGTPRAFPWGDYVNIEAGPPSREAMAATHGIDVAPERAEIDGSGYAWWGSEIMALVWGDGPAEWMTVSEIRSRLVGRRFWTAARVDEALESGFRVGVLERGVRGGVVVCYKPITAKDLRLTALERILKGEPEV